ncbi:MAG: hypothetical protein WA979_06755 [Pacificimonas sp.]
MDDASGTYSSAEEPDFDAPPVFAEQDERRMHVRAYNHWAGLLRGREFPAPGDLDPDEIDDFGPNSVLIDFGADKDNPILRYIGGRLRSECDLDDAEIGYEKVPSRSLLSRLTDHYFEIIANRAPIGFEAEFTSRRGNNTMYRGILMPLSADGGTIDTIYGVINWKEVADEDVLEELSMGAASLGKTAIESAPPADDIEDMLFGNGAQPGAGPDLDLAAPVPQPLAADAGLYDRLAHARDAALGLKGANDRSRAALYAALSEAWDFYLGTRAAPNDYAELLEDSGLKVQARAPMTPIVKLVFGADYDKTRLTEFSAALAYAARRDVAAGGFSAFAEAHEGGLKGLVKAERAARRAETKTPKVDSAAAKKTALRATKPMAQLALDIPGEEEFVLVVAKRLGNGEFGVMGAVPDAESLLQGALRKLK